MPDVTLEHGHTAVLIADFYADMINTLPHATGRGVVANAAGVQAAIPSSSDDVIRASGAL